jgi:predicted dehydrogenase
MAVLGAGKHVWCEKPITSDVDHTVQLMAAATAQGRVALETDMFLHHPQFRTLKSLLESRTLGEIRSVTARFGFPHRDPTDFRYSTAMGGGALLDAGFYPLAAAVAILGTDIRLSGAVMTADEPFEVDTGGSAILSAGGTAAFLDWGFGRAYRSEIEVWCRQATVIAARAFAKPADLGTELRIRHQSGNLEVIPIPAADHFALMLDDFAEVTADSRGQGVESVLARSRLSSAIAAVGVAAAGD